MAKSGRTKVNVKGHYFVVATSTLCHSPLLSEMVKQLDKTNRKELTLDRDPVTFHHILRYLRRSNLLPGNSKELRDVYIEAKYFRLYDLMTYLEKMFPAITKSDSPSLSPPISDSHEFEPHKPRIKRASHANSPVIDIEDAANPEIAPCLSGSSKSPHICSLSLPNQCLCRQLQGLLIQKDKQTNSEDTKGICDESVLSSDIQKSCSSNALVDQQCLTSSTQSSDPQAGCLANPQTECSTNSEIECSANSQIEYSANSQVGCQTSQECSASDIHHHQTQSIVSIALKDSSSEGTPPTILPSDEITREEHVSIENCAGEATVVSTLTDVTPPSLNLNEKDEVCVPLVEKPKIVLHADPKKNVFSWEEIQKHHSRSDCWLVNRGKIYDVTEMLKVHPAGVSAIVKHGGTDATEHFNFHSKLARGFWRKYEIGRVEGGQKSCVVM